MFYEKWLMIDYWYLRFGTCATSSIRKDVPQGTSPLGLVVCAGFPQRKGEQGVQVPENLLRKETE